MKYGILVCIRCLDKLFDMCRPWLDGIIVDFGVSEQTFKQICIGRKSRNNTHATTQWSDASRLNGIGMPSLPTGGPTSNAESTDAHMMNNVDSAKCRPGQILYTKGRSVHTNP